LLLGELSRLKRQFRVAWTRTLKELSGTLQIDYALSD
jgi:hypothetical protein